MKGFSYEKRYLKRPKLGPPDVYPQEPKQKEDELTISNVKHGFAAYPQLTDEFGSARNCNVTASKIGAYFNAIIGKKDEINTLPDSGRKRQQINPKDNFWPATARTKPAVEAWFKDLSGSKSLLALSKKAPNFNKKEEIFPLLCEFQVPMLRAAWFIKLSSAYTVAVTEAKLKKRQVPDPTQEWTGTLLKFLKEQLLKIQDFYQNSSQTVMNDEQKLALKLWQYSTQLLRYLYQEGLMDRQEVLNWTLELVERFKTWPVSEDGPLRLIIPVVLQYLEEFTQSELLARKLAYICVTRLALFVSSSQQAGENSPSSPLNSNHLQISNNSNVLNSIGGAGTGTGPLVAPQGTTNAFSEYMNCPHHRDAILALSVIIQAVTLECPTALVWNSIGEGKSASLLNGSPLDQLPCPPSQLPMPPRNANNSIRHQLRQFEARIKMRSSAAENKWSCDKWQSQCSGTTHHRVLSALDALDSHNFYKVESNNSLDTLYAKIFPNPPDKATYTVDKDESIVNVLCWWAVSGARYGEHRAMAVAKLLERRNTHVLSGGGSDTPDSDDKDSVSSILSGLPVFQPLLMKFLDNDAPVIDSCSSQSNRTMFTNLVHLFSELVRHDVFSHDAYMCTLISRGDLINHTSPAGNMNPGSGRPSSNKPIETPTTQIHLDSDPSALFDIKPAKLQEEGGSPKEGAAGLASSAMETDGGEGAESTPGIVRHRPSRHLLYSTHFPLPQDESCSHECNQRHVLLYGVGRVRDEARHIVKRTAKDICKLFSKKFSIDVSEGGKVKKHSRNEFNFESTTARIQALSYFDQHVVTWQCAMTVLEMISSFASGNSNYLPVPEHVAFLFDLMELALNIYGLIDVCIQILKEIPEVEAQIAAKCTNQVRTYTTNLVLYIVGVLRRYHCCLLLSGDQTVSVFEGLCRVVKHISNPADCSSAERCVLSHLYDLYSSCSLLKTRPHGAEPFSNAYPKIMSALYSPILPSQSVGPSSPFMADVISSARRNMKIESSWVRQLNDSSDNRYSYVCNAIVAVCGTTDIERLNDLGHLSAELTATCNALSSEWLGVLMSLCYSSTSPSYLDVLNQVDSHDLTIHNSLAVFTCILVARHCFSLADFVRHVAIPSLLRVYHEGGRDIDMDAEAGARLTCHLLLRLFKTSEVPQPSLYSVGTSPHPLPMMVSGASSMRLSCDRHLLAAAHNNIMVAPVLAVLKAILVVGDAMVGRGRTSKAKQHKMTPPSGSSELSISHILGTSDILAASRDDLLMELGAGGSMTPTGGLSELAQFVLKEMCSEEWILERCLQKPEELCTEDLMLDSMLTPKQAQRLLHMICYPDRSVSFDASLDQKTLISNILENLELWTVRVSWLDMQLMLKQLPQGSPELNQWLDTVAKAAISLFNLSPTLSKEEGSSKGKSQSMWLVAPLIAKLDSAVQARVLKVAGQVLESSNWFTSRGNKGQQQGAGKAGAGMGHHQPFLDLVLTCLKDQEDQRESLLMSLHSQLSQCLQVAKEDRNYAYESEKSRGMMQDGLLLRFSLIGGMFDTIQRSTQLTTDWALLLVQLVTYGVIDLNNNSELFNTVIDMLATLIHSTLVSDSQSDKCEENRKHYQNLMKKLKKEVGERQSPSIQYIRQLLPLPKKQYEVIACGQMGLLTDMKGNKIDFDGVDKHGLKVTEKQRMSPWDILEGQKAPAPLSWSWFGAVRVERRLLPSEETHRLLYCHTHSLIRDSSYFLDPLPLPPEDIDPPKPMKGGLHAESTPPSVESPRGGKRGPGKQAMSVRRKKQPKPGTPVMQHLQMVNPEMQGGGGGGGGPGPVAGGPMYGAGGAGQPGQVPGGPGQGQGPGGQPGPGGMFPGPGAGGPQQWQMYQQQHPQQVFYPQQQQLQQGGPRGVGGVGTKQALSNMLRMRLPPSGQYMGQGQPQVQNFQPMPRQQMYRQQMQGPGMGGAATAQGAQMFPGQQQQMYPNIQQQGMNQSYGGYGGGGGGMNSGIFPDQSMMRTPDYQQRMRPPYMQQAPNVTMNSMGGPLSQPAPPYSQRPQNPQQQQHFTQQQLSQQQQNMRMRQLMAMQQQQQSGGQQQNSNIVQQLQRQMQGQQPQQQSHMYQQQPPPY